MKKIFNKYGWYLLFTGMGAFGGYLYWYYIGCQTGTCPITSHWYTTGLYGALLGYLSGDLIRDIIRKIKKRGLSENTGE